MINPKTFSGICYGIIFIALGADFAFAQETHKQTIQLQKPVVTQNQQLQKINPNTQLAPKEKADTLKIENRVQYPNVWIQGSININIQFLIEQFCSGGYPDWCQVK